MVQSMNYDEQELDLATVRIAMWTVHQLNDLKFER